MKIPNPFFFKAQHLFKVLIVGFALSFGLQSSLEAVTATLTCESFIGSAKMRIIATKNWYLYPKGEKIQVYIDDELVMTKTTNDNTLDETYLLPIHAPGRYKVEVKVIYRWQFIFLVEEAIVQSNTVFVDVQNLELDATEDESGVVKLSWDPAHEDSGVDGYILKRIDDNNNYKTLETFVSREDDYEEDKSGTPGYNYEYQIVATGNTALSDTDLGRSLATGKISGLITSPIGTGVGGIKVTATRIGTVEGSTATTYTAYTNRGSGHEGEYTIRDIYYNTFSSFTVVPSK